MNTIKPVDKTKYKYHGQVCDIYARLITPTNVMELIRYRVPVGYKYAGKMRWEIMSNGVGIGSAKSFINGINQIKNLYP